VRIGLGHLTFLENERIIELREVFFATIRGVSMLRLASQPPRHFLSLLDTTPEELHNILDRAIELKALHRQGLLHQPFHGRVLGMIFENPVHAHGFLLKLA